VKSKPAGQCTGRPLLAKVFAVGSSKSRLITAPNSGVSGTAPLPSSAVAMEGSESRPCGRRRAWESSKERNAADRARSVSASPEEAAWNGGFDVAEAADQ